LAIVDHGPFPVGLTALTLKLYSLFGSSLLNDVFITLSKEKVV
jgi:hypothetical protein